jgi:hypothetical protein
MRYVGWVSGIVGAGAAVLVLSAAPARALASASPAPAAKAVAQMPAAQTPDLAFKDVQVFFPAFSVGLRLVPPGEASQTSVLRLIENPGTAPGTKLGPDQPNGQPGPIATRSCRDPLRASMRVWVANLGAGPFDATTAALGLTGTVSGQAVNMAFGKVAAGQTQYVEAGALSLAPGAIPVVLTLNSAHGGGEQNFANNTFETRFLITCDCPPGQVRAAATGSCVAPPKPPTATQTPKPPTATATPKQPPATPTPARNPLTGGSGNPPAAPTAKPTPVGISQAGGGANLGVNAGAAPAAMAVAMPQPATPTPRPLLGGGMQVASCVQNGVIQRYVAAVNRTKNGVTFTPGKTYEIAGCGFGATAGQVYLGAYISGQGNKKIPLTVTRWGEQSVTVQPDESLNSLPDVGSVSLNLIPSGEPESRGIGFTAGLNLFETEKETRWVRPGVGYARPSGVWGHAVIGIDASGERTLVTRKFAQSMCPEIATPTDDWDVRKLLDLGFKILNVDFVNQTDKTVRDSAGIQEVVVGSTGEARFVPSARVVRVWWEGHSTYEKALDMSTVGGSSVCTSAYAIRLQVQGPKGVNPFP